MCSHEKITWEVVRNTVAHRMIDNSLIHKFTPSQKIRKRTKLMNAEIKKRGIIKNYNVYKTLKTHVTHKVPVDYDTDDTDYLSDVDYSIIHNSNSKLKQYRIKNYSRIKKTFSLTSDEDEMDQTIKRMKINSSTKSVEKRTKKSVRKQLKKSVDIRQQDNYISQAYFFDNKDDGDDEKSEAMRTTKKNSKTKTVENNTKKSLNIRQKDFVSQGLYTSDENDDVKESQTIRKTKENSKVKPVEKSTKESINIEQHFTSQALFTSDENDYEKESQMICKTKKNNTVKPVEKKSKKSVNIGWQEIVKKKNRSTTLVFDNKQHIDILNDSKQNVFQSDECDGSKTISNKRSLSPKLESQDDMISCTTKSANKDAPQNHSNTISVIPETDSPSNSGSDSQNNILHNTTQNHEDSIVVRETNFELNVPITAVLCETDPKEEIIINRENDTMQREVIINIENDAMQKEFVTDEKMMDKSNYSLSLQISSNDEMHESKLATLNIQSSPINDSPSSISKRSQSSVSKDRSCEELIKVEEKSSINANNCDDGLVSSKSSALINNAKRNLTLMLDTVDCTQVSSLNASHDQEKDSGIDEDSQDKFMKQRNEANKENQNNVTKIVEKVSVSSEPAKTNEVTEEVREDYIKETNLKVDDMTFKEQDTADDAETKEPETDTPELNQTEEEDAKLSCEVKTLEDPCNVQKKQIQPKVTSTEIVNKRYKIVCKRDDDVNVAREDAECNSSKHYTSTSCPSTINDDIDDIDDIDDTSIREINEISVAQETEHEEDEEDHANIARCVSPRTEKRLQQLNLIVDSDSSDSENENEYRSIIDRDSEGHTGNSNMSHSNTEDTTSQNDVPEEMDTAALRRDDTRQDVHAELENDEGSNVSEKSDAKQRERVEDDQRSHISEENSVDVSHDKDNVSNEERPGNDERICTSGKRHNNPASPNDSNMDNEDDQRQKDVRYRPCNLEELVEDEELLMETLPASLTLADISEDEEAFILNIPDKILQNNLQGQLLILKDKTIRFGKSKFRAVHNKVNTVSCIFATGKRQKPYKIVNLKEISTITVRERLLRPIEDATEPNSSDVDISSNEKSRKKRCISKY
ncbi:dentin sialophosphoprotein-like [Odontomachus brunneus]|uniref:dentin sialophosphoprotein-like n=1 Tax=Odontomachus brunneus TaxID=486640 RepID=UPI0013F1CB54|nr:dentin sialophosphoprotein-like [Odontomachus brunneus]